MYELLRVIADQIIDLKPGFISRNPTFTFITFHYFYITGVAIIGSICVFPGGNIHYIDALFLASGGATQSGLNTVNINDLDTRQQVVLFILPILTNPIIINTFVVFLRLYWFEKRFQHITAEANRSRRSIGRSLTVNNTQERNIDHEERGVRGRDIVVLHDSTQPNATADDVAAAGDMDDFHEKLGTITEKEKAPSSNESGPNAKGESSESGSERARDIEAKHQPQIKFADQVKRSNGLADEDLRMPIQRSQEEHIAFLQRQRIRDGDDQDAVLRIPGPRDADAGVAPVAVEESDTLDRVLSRQSENEDHFTSLGANDQPRNSRNARPRNIDFAEPTRPTRSPPAEHVAENVSAFKHTLGIFFWWMKKPEVLHSEENHNDEENGLHATHSRIRGLINALSRDKEEEETPYLSWQPTIGRNSAFQNLTETQREELGGIEYRSLKALAVVLTFYNVGFSLFGVLCLLPWIQLSKTYGSIIDMFNQGRTWWAIFTANSAFTDLGFTLTPNSMASFNDAVWPLLLMSFLIVIGNTGFPIMLRIIIWVMSKCVPRYSGIYEELKFLLDHPRRCFTLLFPGQATWVLFWILVGLNGLDLILFIVLDLGKDSILYDVPLHIRFLDGWFQAVSTRTAGFGVVNLGALHVAVQVSYLVMMYISVFPIAISVRRTNVYEEKALGIYGSPNENEDEADASYIGTHLRHQLSFDLWYIFLGLFIISISEGKRLASNAPPDIAFTMFSVLFEIVSAYGTVGLSLGYTGIDASFSAEFGTVAKLVIIAMQIRGRHRGLPYDLDRAIILPSEQLQEEDHADDEARTLRRNSMASSHNAPVSSGAAKSNRMRRSRSNLIVSLLHPGPTIPNSHRDSHHERKTSKSTFTSEAARERRNSKATFASGRARSISPRYGTECGIPLDGVLESRSQKSQVSGRRSFFQDGVNPPPSAGTLSPQERSSAQERPSLHERSSPQERLSPQMEKDN